MAKTATSKLIRQDFSDRYWESTLETLIGLYARRDSQTGQPIEDINDIIYRVAGAVAIAELKYVLTPAELINTDFNDALNHPLVLHWTEIFANAIGMQKFWANTPANINADPEIALKVLKYWAHGKEAGLAEDKIWQITDELRAAVASNRIENLSPHQREMGRLATELKGRGTLAACGVTYVVDTLESIQDAARTEALAAKSAMGMGLNTSPLRPWSSVISGGAAASGPDRFYEKTIAKAVEAVAQGGRRGGALIELRNSNHPDILFFVDKKKLTPAPELASIYKGIRNNVPQNPYEDEPDYKKRILSLAQNKYGEEFAKYMDRQNYLKNTNVTVLAMPGFIEAVREKHFYPSVFEGKNWTGPLFDPRRPLLDERTKQPKVNKLTKEFMLEEYSVDLKQYPEAREAARLHPSQIIEEAGSTVKVKGHFYAPDVFARIISGMRTSGEPGIAFYETINAGNANSHVYDLNTCNPCGEQFLPAGPGADGRVYMGNCNLSSIHAAHKDFWKADGSYDMEAMQATAKIQQRFMDNVTDVSWYPLPAQNLTARLERRNGGGFAGVAEYLSRLVVEFGKPEALAAVEQLFRSYAAASVESSMELARERGVYPLWEGSKYQKRGLAVRNTCMINNAPTGTLAQAEQTSWGVDPHNGIVFSRKVRSQVVDFVAPGFRELMQKHDAWPQSEEGQQELMQKIRDNHKSCRGLSEVPEPVQKAFPIRVEVEPEDYIRHLAAIHAGSKEFPESFNSVSNTCSIPPGVNAESIRDALLLAYDQKVKDVTFYPDGSRLSQPIETIARQESSSEDDLLNLLTQQHRRIVNIEETSGVTYKVKVGTPDGSSTLHVSLNHERDYPGGLIEVYARMGKPGAVESGLFEAVGRLASAFLQYASQFGESERAKVEATIVRQLINIQSGYPAFHKFAGSQKSVVIQSPCDGLARAMLQYRRQFAPPQATGSSGESAKTASAAVSEQTLESTHTVIINEQELSLIAAQAREMTCSKCGEGPVVHIDGCWTCQNCGFSKCA